MNQLLLLISILIVCVILFLPIILNSKSVENFYEGYFPYPNYLRYPLLNDRIWWNSSPSTRNMSYDLRGDVPIPMSYVGPWNISSFAPIVY